MSGAPARAAYARRMQHVVDHIDAHLGEPLALADLAAVAHFSPFHFHRLFAVWMGETLGDYLRRRRLEVAALRLLTQPRTPVLGIALMVGFGSGEAFARAFKLRFQRSPTEWRRPERATRLRKIDQPERNPDQAGEARPGDDHATPSTVAEPAMKVQVVEREPVRLVALRYVGPYGEGVARFWQQRFYPFLAQQGLFGRHVYGIGHDDPQIVAPEKCRYDTCVEVDASYVAPAGASLQTLPGGRYGVLPFLGTAATLGPVWTALLRDWLPDSGYQLDGRPTFEHYPPDATFDAATGTFSCEIVIPLAPLRG